VRKSDPLLLIQRIRNLLVKSYKKLLLHCSPVSCNRGKGINKRTLNSQKFHFNVSYKDPSSAPDMEYRLSLTDTSLNPELKSDKFFLSEIVLILLQQRICRTN